ncbi:hypothetical protein IF2G_01658 [Cordyceps javanica]|nr:hypothetical protein IF2G_01658 [Cordyceps javanica]
MLLPWGKTPFSHHFRPSCHHGRPPVSQNYDTSNDLLLLLLPEPVRKTNCLPPSCVDQQHVALSTHKLWDLSGWAASNLPSTSVCPQRDT